MAFVRILRHLIVEQHNAAKVENPSSFRFLRAELRQPLDERLVRSPRDCRERGRFEDFSAQRTVLEECQRPVLGGVLAKVMTYFPSSSCLRTRGGSGNVAFTEAGEVRFIVRR